MNTLMLLIAAALMVGAALYWTRIRRHLKQFVGCPNDEATRERAVEVTAQAMAEFSLANGLTCRGENRAERRRLASVLRSITCEVS